MAKQLDHRVRLEHSLKLIEKTVGEDWIKDRDQRWNKKDSKHPVTSTFHFARLALSNLKNLVCKNEHATKVAFWAYVLQKIGSRFDEDVLCRWLRDKAECETVLYTLQIASLFLNAGYEIKFNDKPPHGYDFHVICADGIVPIECKKKGQTKRNQEAQLRWDHLSQRLLKLLKRLRKSAFVWVESRKDPSKEDLALIEGLITQVISDFVDQLNPNRPLYIGFKKIQDTELPSTQRLFGIHTETKESIQPDEDFFIVIQHAIDSATKQVGSVSTVARWYDQPFWGVGTAEKPFRYQQGYGMGPAWRGIPQHAFLETALRRVGDDSLEVRDFSTFGFRSNEQPDYVTTIISSLAEIRKRKQLPPQGPRLVFIDIARAGMNDINYTDPVKMRFDETVPIIQN